MNDLSDIVIVLAVVFALSLVGIVAKLCLVLYRWRKFRQRNRVDDDPEFSAKVPDSLPPADVAGVLTWQGLYGASRVLFTIKEEEREEVEIGYETSSFEEKKKRAETKGVCLEEPEVAAVTVGVGVDEATPFSTPCDSPFYYTPSSSPAREVEIYGGIKSNDSPVMDGSVALASVCEEV